MATLDCNGTVSWTFSDEQLRCDLHAQTRTAARGRIAHRRHATTAAPTISTLRQLHGADVASTSGTVTATSPGTTATPGTRRSRPPTRDRTTARRNRRSRRPRPARSPSASRSRRRHAQRRRPATGAVTFQVFAPGDTSCATPLATLATSPKNVDGNGNGTYTSPATRRRRRHLPLARLLRRRRQQRRRQRRLQRRRRELDREPGDAVIATKASGPVAVGGRSTTSPP